MADDVNDDGNDGLEYMNDDHPSETGSELNLDISEDHFSDPFFQNENVNTLSLQ